mmetsp:Transcript_23951/g.59517  ORF Transcript_23951/g.59517 Transcript_23951/m.59517 type:complete len:99 (-) Transcript_23951:417-713(-)
MGVGLRRMALQLVQELPVWVWSRTLHWQQLLVHPTDEVLLHKPMLTATAAATAFAAATAAALAAALAATGAALPLHLPAMVRGHLLRVHQSFCRVQWV